MRKLIALSVAALFCMSGTALANDYFIQLFPSPAPNCAITLCTDPDDVTCNQPLFGFLWINVVVDCHKGQGFKGVNMGMDYVGGAGVAVSACPGALVVANPEGIGGSAVYGECMPCCTAIFSAGVSQFGPGSAIARMNMSNGRFTVIDCNDQEQPAACSGQASFGGGPAVVCQCAGATSVEPSSWGSVKAIFN